MTGSKQCVLVDVELLGAASVQPYQLHQSFAAVARDPALDLSLTSVWTSSDAFQASINLLEGHTVVVPGVQTIHVYALLLVNQSEPACHAKCVPVLQLDAAPCHLTSDQCIAIPCAGDLQGV